MARIANPLLFPVLTGHPGIVAVAGLVIVNALAGRIAASIAEQGIMTATLSLFGLGPLEIAAIALVLWRLQQSGVPGALAPSAIAIALALLPSGTAAWVGLGLLGLGLVRAAPQAGLSLLMLALHGLWSGPGINLLGGTVAAADAGMLRPLLALTGTVGEGAGPLIRVSADHALLVLPGCTAAVVMPLALTLFVALLPAHAFDNAGSRRALMARGVALLLALQAMGLARLAVMALSPTGQEIGHGPIGSGLFELGLVLCLLLAVWLPGRTRARATTPSPPAPAAGAWLCVIAAMALLGLGGKAMRYAAPPQDPLAGAEAALTSTLAHQGWRVVEVLPLTATGTWRAIRLARAGCTSTAILALALPGDPVPLLLHDRFGGATRLADGAVEVWRAGNAPPPSAECTPHLPQPHA